MGTRLGLTARAMPAQTIIVAGPCEPALATIQSELQADGWRERVRVFPTGVIYEIGSATKAFWLGDLISDVVPTELLPKRMRRSIEHGQAALYASQQGELAIVEVALVWRETSTIGYQLQKEFRAAIERAIARFQSAGVLVEAGPVSSAYDIPKDRFCSPANRKSHLRTLNG